MTDQIHVNPYTEEDEISLRDILTFLQKHSKKILYAIILGAIVGLVGSILLGQYKVEEIIVNNKLTMLNQEQTNANSAETNKTDGHAINFLMWRTLEKQLPTLAQQQLLQNKISPDQLALYQSMKEPKWWDKNVMVAYSLSKSDMKDFAVISKDLQDNDAQTILGLMINESDKDKARAEQKAFEVAKFIRTGSIYLQLQSLLDKYDAEVVTNTSELSKKSIDLKVKRQVLQSKIQHLEDLRRRYPQKEMGREAQVLNINDEQSKYMPITTQLIAANVEMNNVDQRIQEYQELNEQLQILKRFVALSHDVMVKGLSSESEVAQQLLNALDQLSVSYAQNNMIAEQMLSQIRNDITLIEARFTKGLILNPPLVSHTSKLLPTLLGALIAGFLMVMYQLVLAALRSDTVDKSK